MTLAKRNTQVSPPYGADSAQAAFRAAATFTLDASDATTMTKTATETRKRVRIDPIRTQGRTRCAGVGKT
jgi:hypothetical protein